MSIVNRNNVTKGADRVVTGINHAKTLSLSKGTDKGCITFAAKGNNVYYYYGNNSGDKYSVCTAPCTVSITVADAQYNISGNTQIRLKLSPATGAFVKADYSADGGASFTNVISTTNGFSGVNRIVINNNHGKTANIDLNVHVGTVKVSY
jgi:hypothetical protein